MAPHLELLLRLAGCAVSIFSSHEKSSARSSSFLEVSVHGWFSLWRIAAGLAIHALEAPTLLGVGVFLAVNFAGEHLQRARP